MTKVKYNVKGVEPGKDFDTPIPVGLYTARISEAEEKTSNKSGNEMIALTLEIAHGDWEGRMLWDYIVLNDASAWKMRQLIDALSMKDSGTLDLVKITGTMVQVRVKHETDDEYGTRSKVGAILPMPEGEAASIVDEEEEGEAETDDEREDDELTWDDLQEYDREDMETLIEENELDVTFNKRTSDEKLRDRIAEEYGLEADEEEEAEGDEDSYDEMSLEDLKAEAKERGLSPAGTKKVLVKKLEKNDAEGSDEEPF